MLIKVKVNFSKETSAYTVLVTYCLSQNYQAFPKFPRFPKFSNEMIVKMVTVT